MRSASGGAGEQSPEKACVRRPTARAARFAVGIVLAAALLLTGACGNLTSGGVGEVEVVVASDSVDAAVGAMSGLEGTLHLQVRVFVRQEPGEWEEVTDGRLELALDLATRETQAVERTELREGRYDGVRILFERIVAEVTGGLVVDGEAVTGPVRVDLGTEGRVVVDLPLEFRVRSDQVVSLLLELKAERWLRRLDLATCSASDCRVGDDAFRDELRVQAREERMP